MSNLQKDPKTPSVNPSKKYKWSDDTNGFLKLFGDDQLFFAAIENKDEVAKYPPKEKPKPRMFHNGFAAKKAELDKLNSEGWGVFHTVNVMKGNRRIKSEVKRCRAVFIDDDHPRDEPRTDFPIEPNIIVESSPGKYHYYWLTDTDQFEEWNGVMATMVEEHGADNNAKDLARVLRLPGFNHVKGDPHKVTYTVVKTEPYSWDEIKEHFPPADGKTDSKGNKKPAGWKPQEDHIKAIIEGDNFHGSLQSVISNHANTPGIKKDTLILIARGLVSDALLSNALDDKRTARAERMLSPGSTEIADMVDWSLSSNEAEDKAKKVNLDKCKDPMAELRRQYGVTEDDVKDIGEEKYIYEDLLIEGHILTLIGEAGAGKTALFVHLAPEFVKAGYTVNYINLDAPWNELPRLQQFAVDGGYTLLSPDVKKGGLTIEGLVEFIKQMSLLDNSLIGEVFIFDTLKRCVDMMSKGQLKEFYAMCRKLSARGASVVLLGHANKKRDHNGNLIFEGTGDVRNDTDELLFLECKDDENGNRFVSTYVDSNCGAKVRGKFKPMTFIIKRSRSVIKSLIYIDTKKAKKEELKIQKHRDLYDFIVSYVKKHPGKNQREITEAAKDAGHPKKTARDLLVTLSDVDSDKQCLYSRESKKHPYSLEYYTLEYAEGKISKGEKL